MCVVVLEDLRVKSQQESWGSWAVSCRLQAPLPPHSYNIGREGHIKLSRARSPCCKVTAFLHCYMCSSWKRYFPKACSEALHGSAVTGVTFLLPGGDSLDSAAQLVWGLWCFLKGALCLIALHTLHHGCFASFLTERWLTGTSVYWLSSVKIYYESKIFYVEPSLLLRIIILYCFHLEATVLHIFDCSIAQIVTYSICCKFIVFCIGSGSLLIIELIKSDCKNGHQKRFILVYTLSTWKEWFNILGNMLIHLLAKTLFVLVFFGGEVSTGCQATRLLEVTVPCQNKQNKN